MRRVSDLDESISFAMFLYSNETRVMAPVNLFAPETSNSQESSNIYAPKPVQVEKASDIDSFILKTVTGNKYVHVNDPFFGDGFVDEFGKAWFVRRILLGKTIPQNRVQQDRFNDINGADVIRETSSIGGHVPSSEDFLTLAKHFGSEMPCGYKCPFWCRDMVYDSFYTNEEVATKTYTTNNEQGFIHPYTRTVMIYKLFDGKTGKIINDSIDYLKRPSGDHRAGTILIMRDYNLDQRVVLSLLNEEMMFDNLFSAYKAAHDKNCDELLFNNILLDLVDTNQIHIRRENGGKVIRRTNIISYERKECLVCLDTNSFL
jgi:hypothetical protein